MTVFLLSVAGVATLTFIVYINIVAWNMPPLTPDEEEEERADMQVW